MPDETPGDGEYVPSARYEVLCDIRPDRPDAKIFAQRLTGIRAAMQVLADQVEMEPVRATIVLADDFRAAVDEALRSEADRTGEVHRDFTVERLGGVVAAKNIPTSDDGSAVTVVMNSQIIGFENSSWDIFSTFLLLHELVHPIQERVRRASGVLDGVQFPSATASETSRSIVRVAADEYRADLIAHFLTQQLLRPTDDAGSEVLPSRYMPASYQQALAAAAGADIHPGWPDRVEDYQHRRISLDELYGPIWTQTDQLVTAAAHAEAERRFLDAEPEIFAASAPAAVQLYLAPMWEPIRHLLDSQPVLPTAAELREHEPVLLNVAEESLRAMWTKLGLEFTDHADRTMYLSVASPMR